jgi:precorrin-6A/cobalt-precorrin-6A reductase
VILVLGGTSETAPMAEALARRGYSVLVSTVTEISLDTGDHPLIQRRSGPLEEKGLINLISSHTIQAIVDVTHPYALEISRLASTVSEDLGLPYFRLNRPEVIPQGKEILRARDHPQAASLAVLKNEPVLLTTGSKHLEPYVEETSRKGLPLIVRVLPDPHSIQTCLQAGIPLDGIVTGRGPFSVEENRELIRKYNIGVLVTKDSGTPGGALAKIEAAENEGCLVVVVTRTKEKSEKSFDQVEDLLEAVSKMLTKDF